MWNKISSSIWQRFIAKLIFLHDYFKKKKTTQLKHDIKALGYKIPAMKNQGIHNYPSKREMISGKPIKPLAK